MWLSYAGLLLALCGASHWHICALLNCAFESVNCKLGFSWNLALVESLKTCKTALVCFRRWHWPSRCVFLITYIYPQNLVLWNKCLKYIHKNLQALSELFLLSFLALRKRPKKKSFNTTTTARWQNPSKIRATLNTWLQMLPLVFLWDNELTPILAVEETYADVKGNRRRGNVPFLSLNFSLGLATNYFVGLLQTCRPWSPFVR